MTGGAHTVPGGHNVWHDLTHPRAGTSRPHASGGTASGQEEMASQRRRLYQRGRPISQACQMQGNNNGADRARPQ